MTEISWRGLPFIVAILALALSGAVFKRYGVPAPVKVHIEADGPLSVSTVQYFYGHGADCQAETPTSGDLPQNT